MVSVSAEAAIAIAVGSFAMGSQNRPENLKNNEIEHQSQQVMVRAAHGSGMQYPYRKEKGSISKAKNSEHKSEA